MRCGPPFGVSEQDQRAGTDAFDVLDLIVERRLARGLLTVVDTLGLDRDRRARYLDLARRHRLTVHAVVFDTPADVCRARNRTRARPLPAPVLAAQLKARDQAAHRHRGRRVRRRPRARAGRGRPVRHAGARRLPPAAGPAALRAAAVVVRRAGSNAPPLADRMAEAAALAEAVGFTSLWVMDHMVQIPQVGRRWDDLPESWTTLAWLAARTRTIRLGTLVTGVTLRNPAHLAKIVATLDVLSGGRAICGLGLAWWEWEHQLYGWPFPSTADRYALLEDTLQLLPVMWGPGSPPFAGHGPFGGRDHLLPTTAAGARPHHRRRIGADHHPPPGRHATPMAATCSATRQRWPASGPSWSGTAPMPAATRRRCGSPTCPTRWWPGRDGRWSPPSIACGRPACRRNRPRTGGAPGPSTTRSGGTAASPKPASRRPSSPCPTFSPLARWKPSAR